VTDEEIAENQERREKIGYAPNPFCNHCLGAGWVYPVDEKSKPDYSKTIECAAKNCIVDQRREFQKTGKFLELRGVTERLQTFKRFHILPGTKESYEAFCKLAEGETKRPFLLCYGGIGNGKTYLCQALTTALNKRGIDTYYYGIPGLFNALRTSIEDNSTDEWVTSLGKCPGLVLDDFGSESHSEFCIGKLQEIIDARWTHKLITVMTLNKTLIGTPEDPGLQLISPRIYSRMCDQDLSVVVHNKGIDYRTERRNQK